MLAAVVALCAGCTAGGGAAATGEKGQKLTEVIIASDLPLTGSARAQTESMVEGIEMRLAENNHKANGVKITYKSLDDSTAQAGKWDEAKCADNMNSLAQDPKVVVVIGPMNSGCAQIQVKTANMAGLAMISPAATAVGLTKQGGSPGEPDKYYPSGVRNFLRVVPADDLQAAAAATWAKELGIKRAFVINDKETYGKGLADQFEGAAENLGIHIVENEGIDPMASNYRSLIPKIVAGKAELVYFGGITQNNAGQLLKDIRAASKNIQFMGPDGIFEDAFIDAAGDAAPGAHATLGGTPPEKLTGKGKLFVQNYTKQHGPPQAYTAYAYDAAGLAVEAIERCAKGDGVNRPCVLEQMFATKDYEGALGTFSITETGDTTLTTLTGLTVKSGAWQFDRLINIAKGAAG